MANYPQQPGSYRSLILCVVRARECRECDSGAIRADAVALGVLRAIVWTSMGRDKSVILTYHSLDLTGSAISITPGLFRIQIENLARSGTPVVPLSSVQQHPGSVALTFDDGYRNFFEHALPVLVEYQFPATVFVVTGYCGLHNGWRSRQRYPSRLELMGWRELREAARLGVALGAHTVHHPDLSTLSEGEVVRELSDCRASLEDQTGHVVETFAYPYGAWSPTIRFAVSRQFRLGCGTALRFVDSRSDPFVLPRVDASYRPWPWWFGRLMSGPSQIYLAVQRWRHTAAALVGRHYDGM
jgi:peptidoglycan/xylan/chitin deacetylase (PgdA/CDA1 family)